MSQTVKPSNSSPLQHALAQLTAAEALELDIDIITRSLDPAVCSAAFLPWLAWEYSISLAEGWDFAETDTARRNLIQSFISLHQRKGTPYAIRQLFRDLQLGEIDIIEKASSLRWNGVATFDGTYQFGGNDGDWAKYAIVLKRQITNQQAELLRRIIEEIAPLRCELLYLDFRNTPLKWNGEITFNGQYNYGAA